MAIQMVWIGITVGVLFARFRIWYVVFHDTHKLDANITTTNAANDE